MHRDPRPFGVPISHSWEDRLSSTGTVISSSSQPFSSSQPTTHPHSHTQKHSFLVAIPAIVRSTVASASLPVRAALLEAVAPATVRMGLATELTTPARLAVRLDAFRLDLYNPATPGRPTFVTLAVPAHALRGASPLSVPPQDAAVRHPGELSRFLAATFAAGTAAGRAASGTTRPLPDRRATVGVRGATVARLGAGNTLAYPIRLDKEVRLDGLDRLDGLRVQELTPVSAAEALADPGLGNDTNLRGTLWLPNVSQLTLHLGNVSHRAEVAGVAVGTATIDDLRINPGNQTVAYEGQLDAAAVMANLSAVMGAVDAAGDMELVVKANRAVVDGQHIEYLDEVLSQIGVNTKLSVCDAIKSIPKEVMQNIPPAMMTKLPLKQIMACM